MPADSGRIKQVLDQTLAWTKEEGYLEWTKHDALNSPLLLALFGHHRLSRILATQAVMRFPINLRPLLGVPKSHNPKGLALFVMTLLDLFSATGEKRHLEEAIKLLDQLLALRSPGKWHGDCWGYQYPWQDLGFYASRGTPNAVVTAFVCEAFLHAFRITGDAIHLAPVESAVHFFLDDLAVLKDADEELCFGYMPLPMTMRVMDVSILIAAVLAQLSVIRGDIALRDAASRLTRYVVARQTSDGAWYYTDPPEASPLKIDNYHTGFILDALDRVMSALKIDAWREHHRLGVDYYAAHLFNPGGSPRWMSHRDYPHDIHGAAQGILTFSAKANRERYPRLASNIIDWALDRMYHPDGRFYYQETRYRLNTTTFVRWCNAWMCRALASHLLSVFNEEN